MSKNIYKYPSIFNLIKKYPKKRPALSREVKKIFDIEYKKNRENLLSQLSESWLHFAIRGRNLLSNTTLEIGAGSLNHLKYENFTKKHIYDVIEPKKFLYKNNKNKFLVNKFYKSLSNTRKNTYNRIISCAVLEHLEDLPNYLYLSSQKMKKNGYQSHSIPCEGYPVWNITWFIISGITLILIIFLRFISLTSETVNFFLRKFFFITSKAFGTTLEKITFLYVNLLLNLFKSLFLVFS